ncbi:hypothetical protein SELMODRAFT_101529, partial [Selaginella moellendorffii]
QDRVNCPFYLKMGACRRRDRCSRAHLKPKQSCTLLLNNMYQSHPRSGMQKHCHPQGRAPEGLGCVLPRR